MLDALPLISTGTRLGPYEIREVIGSGGMGVVYRAHDDRLQRDVAVKVLARDLERDPEALGRFEREARAIAALSHPNILAIHDFGVSDGRLFTVTELLRGQSLRTRLASGPMPWKDAADVALAVAEGLAAAHDKGIVHRDLKPDNLYLTDDGRVKVLDFGLARSGEPDADATGATPTRLDVTRPGLVMGTLGYMSPEQARGQATTPTSDIFSLGCVLFEAVYGETPFARATPSDSLAALLNDRPSARTAPVDTSPEFLRIVEHCLEKAPRDRFQSVRDLAFALRAVLGDSGATTLPKGRRPRTTRRSLAVLPFTNAGTDPDAEYVSDGVTETLINELTRIPKLRVVPRATVFRYKGREVDPRTAAVELGARFLLSGRVVQRGDVVDIQAELVDSDTDSQIWGQRFTRRASDLIGVQADIAREICDALKVKLTPAERSRLTKTQQVDPDAYRDYLRGRQFFSRWSKDAFLKAIEAFSAAVAKDPTLAPAYAGLSDAYGAAAYYGYLTAEEAYPRAFTAARHALALEPDLADAHASVAVGYLFHDWDWASAGASLDKAVALNPQCGPARTYRALYLASLGRCDEALAEALAGEALDPLSLLAGVAVAWALTFRGDFEKALRQAHRVLDLDPAFAETRAIILGIHEAQGRFEQAVAQLRMLLPTIGSPPEQADRLLEAYRRGGAAGYWRERLALLADWAYVPVPWLRAELHARLDEAEPMFAALEEAVRLHLGPCVFLRVNLHFERWRGDPRFQAIVRRVGIP